MKWRRIRRNGRGRGDEERREERKGGERGGRDEERKEERMEERERRKKLGGEGEKRYKVVSAFCRQAFHLLYVCYGIDGEHHVVFTRQHRV